MATGGSGARAAETLKVLRGEGRDPGTTVHPGGGVPCSDDDGALLLSGNTNALSENTNAKQATSQVPRVPILAESMIFAAWGRSSTSLFGEELVDVTGHVIMMSC